MTPKKPGRKKRPGFFIEFGWGALSWKDDVWSEEIQMIFLPKIAHFSFTFNLTILQEVLPLIDHTTIAILRHGYQGLPKANNQGFLV